MRSPFSKEELACVLPAFAVVLLVQIRLLSYCADDAYIHFRIAGHLAGDGVPYFNLGEAVMATSSTVWTLVLAATFLISGPNPVAAAVLNSIITVAAGLAFSRLARTLYGQNHKLLSATAFLLTVAALMSSSIQLMETPLALLLLGCGLLAYFKGRSSAFIWLTLACFTRLEMGAFLIVVLIENLMYGRVPLRSAVLKMFLAAIPLIAFDFYFFGTLVPQTVIAKSVIYDLTSSEFITFAAAGLLGKYVFYSFPLVVLIFFTALTTVGIYFCLLHLHPPEYVVRDQRVMVVLAGGLLIFLVYIWRSVYIFPWYVPIYSLPIFFAFLLSAFTKKSVPVKLIAALLITPTAFSFCRDLAAGIINPSLYSEYDGGVRAHSYREVGESLSQTCKECSVMAAEIGGLGSGFRGSIIDAVGLATPDALTYHRKKIGTKRSDLGGMIPVQFVRDRKPDVIVGMKSFLKEIAESDVAKEYRWVDFSPKKATEEKILGEPLQILMRQKHGAL